MLKLCFYVPDSHLEATKRAVFAAGAGRQGNYEHCCFQVQGAGQFRPLAGSTPFVGKQGDLESVVEWRVEMLCPEEVLDAVLAALRLAHPYEEPAIDVWQLLSPGC
jgi:hypothetical protein